MPSVLTPLKEGLIGIFQHGWSYWNNVLWTMRIELIGSLAVYAFFQVCRRRTEWLAALVVVVLDAGGAPAGYVAFATGAVLALANARGFVLPAGCAMAGFAIGLLLGSQAAGFAARHGLSDWPIALRPGDAAGLVCPLGAVLVVAGVLGSPILKHALSSRVCRLLGRLSFPLYLVHVPLLYTVVATAAVHLQPLGPWTLGVVGCVFLGWALTLAWVFDVAVDRPVLALNRRLAPRMRRNPAAAAGA